MTFRPTVKCNAFSLLSFLSGLLWNVLTFSLFLYVLKNVKEKCKNRLLILIAIGHCCNCHSNIWIYDPLEKSIPSTLKCQKFSTYLPTLVIFASYLVVYSNPELERALVSFVIQHQSLFFCSCISFMHCKQNDVKINNNFA